MVLGEYKRRFVSLKGMELTACRFSLPCVTNDDSEVYGFWRKGRQNKTCCSIITVQDYEMRTLLSEVNSEDTNRDQPHRRIPNEPN